MIFNPVFMKKLVLPFALALISLSVQGADFTVGGLGYNVLSEVTKTTSVADCSGATGDVSIPSTVTLGGTSYTVTEIAAQAFYETKISSLTIPESVEKIGNSAFAKCASLKSVNYNAVNCPSAGESSALSAFSGCDALQSVTIGEEVTVIPPYIFSGLGALRSIAIPRKVTEIGRNAFANCTSVSQVFVDAENLGTSTEAFTGCTTSMSVIISDNVKKIPYQMFYGVAGVRSVTVGKSVEVFGSGCFASCKNLKSVTYNCEKRNVSTSWSSSYTIDSPFGSCSALSNLLIGDNVVEIPAGAFMFCDGLTSITFGKSLETIGEYAFKGAGITSFKAPSSLKSIGNSAFVKSKVSLVEFNEGLEVLSGFDETSVREVRIPSTVKTIGYNAFYSSPVTVEGLGNANLERIEKNAFYRTNVSGDLKFGANLVEIGESAFQACKGITSVNFGPKLELIGKNAFYDTGLTGELKLPEGLKRIEDSAFSRTKISGTLVISEQLEYLGVAAFSECTSLEGLEYNAISAEGTSGYSGVFTNVPLTTIMIGDKVKSFPRYIFERMTALERVVLPPSVETIPNGAFSGCTSLKEINLPEGLKELGEYAFDNCSGITEIVIPESLLIINESRNMEHLSKLVFNARECSNGKSYFRPHIYPELTTVVVGPNVKKLKVNLFTGDYVKVVAWNAESVSEFPAAESYNSACTAVVGENVTAFGGYSFSTVISNAPVPPALTLPKAGAEAYVPDVEAYKKDANWSKYVLRQSVTWSGTVDGQKLKYEENFPYELTLKHYLDSEGNVMSGTPCELGNYKAVFTFEIAGEEYELISPLSIKPNTSNTMRAIETRLHAGRTAVIPVEMVNEGQITSFQFDVYLPEGIQLAKDEYGDYCVDLSDRKSNTHTISTNDIEGGKGVRVAAMSMRNHAFAGNDGVIANLTVEIDADAPLGEAVISLRNIRLVEPSSAAEEFYTNRNDTQLSIGGFMNGDTNDDGRVTMADVVNTVNMMLGVEPDVFVFDAADLVTDGKITVSDVVAVMNEAMNAGTKAPRRVSRAEADATEFTGGASADGYGLEVSPVSISTGGMGVMNVGMENEANVTAFQFDLYLPEGISIPEDDWGDPSITLGSRAHRTHVLVTRYQPDGALRVAAYSTQNSSFKGNSGELLDIDLTVAEDVAVGEYEARFTYIELTNPDATPHYVPDFNAIISVGASGVESVEISGAVFTVRGAAGEIIIIAPEDTHVEVCNLSGTVFANTNVTAGVTRVAVPAGFYIVNGTKVLVK